MKRSALCLAAAIMISNQAASPQLPERVAISSFAIDRTEVTIGAYRAARGAAASTAEREGGGFEYTAGWTQRPGWTWATPFGAPGSDNEPAVHLSWAEAREYCQAVGGRLPTRAEWQQAAYTELRDQPTDGFVKGRTYPYPVGDQPDGMNNSRQRHVAVGTTKRGVNGLFDMGGNAWEWLADRQGDDALTAGGSWWYGPEQTRASGIQWKPAKFYAVYIGFRCAYDLTK
jgi:formylglycine-generating enzyme